MAEPKKAKRKTSPKPKPVDRARLADGYAVATFQVACVDPAAHYSLCAVVRLPEGNEREVAEWYPAETAPDFCFALAENGDN